MMREYLPGLHSWIVTTNEHSVLYSPYRVRKDSWHHPSPHPHMMHTQSQNTVSDCMLKYIVLVSTDLSILGIEECQVDRMLSAAPPPSSHMHGLPNLILRTSVTSHRNHINSEVHSMQKMGPMNSH